MLPKNKDKSARKPALQMFKYISPNQPLAMRSHCGSNTRVHTRSMVELEPNTSAQQLPVSSKGNHLSSIHSSHEPTDQAGKGTSLKKFLNMFGTGNSNSLLSLPTAMKTNRDKSQRQPLKCLNDRQVFTCNINGLDNRSLLILKKDKQGKPAGDTAHENLKLANENYELRKSIEEMKNNQRKKNQRYQIDITKLKEQLRKAHEELQRTEQELQRTKEQLQRTQEEKEQTQEGLREAMEGMRHAQQSLMQAREEVLCAREQAQKKVVMLKHKQQEQTVAQGKSSKVSRKEQSKCRQHDLIIDSLKRVINEQLSKIIELEKCKIEREEIDKLQERINHNGLRGGLQFIGHAKRMQSHQYDSEASEHQDSHKNSRSVREMQERSEGQPENEQGDSEYGNESDSILEEVDQYLTQWRRN